MSFIELFTDRRKFYQQIEHLIKVTDRLNNNTSIRKCLDQLKKSIESCINNSVGHVYIFGSRMYGIANDDSDVDLYFDIGNSLI